MDKAWQFCANLVFSMYHCDMSKRDGTLYRIFSRDSTVMMYCMTQYDIIFHRVQNILELCCTVFKSAKLLYLSLWLYIYIVLIVNQFIETARLLGRLQYYCLSLSNILI